MLWMLTAAHAGGLSYHVGGVAIGVDRDRLAAVVTHGDDVAQMNGTGLGLLHSLTYHFKGQTGVAGLDPWIRLGVGLPAASMGHGQATSGELSVYAPANIGPEWFQYVLAFEAGATLVEFEDGRARWDRLTYFHGPQLKLQGDALSVYVSPQVAAILAIWTGRPNLRLVAGISADSGGPVFLNAEIKGEMLRSLPPARVDNVYVTARAGLGLRF